MAMMATTTDPTTIAAIGSMTSDGSTLSSVTFIFSFFRIMNLR